MDNRFFEQPVLNSPYHYPKFHWELDKNHQTTQKINEKRRPADAEEEITLMETYIEKIVKVEVENHEQY